MGVGDLQDRVAVSPIEALQDNVGLVAKPREAAHEGAHPPAAVRGLSDDHPLTQHRRQQPGQGVAHRVVHRPLQAEAAGAQERGSDCKFGCRAIALHTSKKGFGLLRPHSEMGLLVGFKLRLARSNCFG